jgi:transcriptional regulator with XRE-family HTH domain
MDGRQLVAWNMRRLRGARGVSQERLGNDAGVDRTYVSRLERQLENPSIAILEKIARALKVHISELLAEPSPGTSQPNPLRAGRRSK